MRTPQLPPSGDNRFSDTVKEILDVGMGHRGDPKNKFLTVGDLLDIGLAKVSGTLRQGSNLGTVLKPSQVEGTSGASGSAPSIIPPMLANLAAVGLFTRIMVTWDAPAYSNHAYVEIFRAETADFGQALSVGKSVSYSFVDETGGGASYYYWARNVSNQNRNGPIVGPVSAQTVTDPAWLLGQLQNQITESQLYGALNDRLNTMSGQYTMKIDDHGFISGFGLASAPVNGAPFSEFYVNADRFAVVNPQTNPLTVTSITRSGSAAFATTSADHGYQVGDYVVITGAAQGAYNGTQKIIQVTPNTFQFQVEGQPDTPATVADGFTSIMVKSASIPFVVQDGKVMMSSAFITQLTANQINVDAAFAQSIYAQNATLDAAKISIANIFDLAIGNILASTDYHPGSTGWKIQNDYDDEAGHHPSFAEFADVRLRGLLHSGLADANGNAAPSEAYIDFRSGVLGPGNLDTKGDFVLGDVSSGNYVSFKWEDASQQKVLRIRGDVLMKNYTPGDYPLHSNSSDSQVSMKNATGFGFGDPVYTIGRNPSIPVGGYNYDAGIWLNLANTFTTTSSYMVKGTAVSREGLVTVNFIFYKMNLVAAGFGFGAPPVYHLCLKRSDTNVVTRLRSYFPYVGLGSTSPAYIMCQGENFAANFGGVKSGFISVYGSNIHLRGGGVLDTGVYQVTENVSVKPGDIVSVFADMPSLMIGAGADRPVTSYFADKITSGKARSSDLNLSVGFIPFETTIM